MKNYEQFIQAILDTYRVYELSIGSMEFGDFVIEPLTDQNRQRLIEARISPELPRELPPFRATTEELLPSCLKCGWALSSSDVKDGRRVHDVCKFLVGERS